TGGGSCAVVGGSQSTPPPGSPGAIRTLEQFMTALKAEFKPADYNFELRSKLQKLYQKKLSVREHTTQFRKLSLLLNETNQKDITHLYITHLNKDIAWEVIRSRANNLGEAAIHAQNIEDMMCRMGMHKDNNSNQNVQQEKKRVQQPVPTPYPMYHYGMPMELD